MCQQIKIKWLYFTTSKLPYESTHWHFINGVLEVFKAVGVCSSWSYSVLGSFLMLRFIVWSWSSISKTFVNPCHTKKFPFELEIFVTTQEAFNLCIVMGMWGLLPKFLWLMVSWIEGHYSKLLYLTPVSDWFSLWKKVMKITSQHKIYFVNNQKVIFGLGLFLDYIKITNSSFSLTVWCIGNAGRGGCEDYEVTQRHRRRWTLKRWCDLEKEKRRTSQILFLKESYSLHPWLAGPMFMGCNTWK